MYFLNAKTYSTLFGDIQKKNPQINSNYRVQQLFLLISPRKKKSTEEDFTQITLTFLCEPRT